MKEIKYTPIYKGKFADQIETENRNTKAELYSAQCKQKIIIDWQSESAGMYALAGTLLLLLTTIIL